MLRGVAAGSIIQAVNGGGSTMDPSDTSTGEPIAVRRRLDLDGSFTGSEMRGIDDQWYPISESTDTGNADCDVFLGINNIFSGSGSIKNDLTDPNTSGSPVEIQHQTDVSESSESCKLSGRDETSERGISGNSEREVTQISDTDSGSSTDAQNVLAQFGGSTYSLVELDFAYEKASESLNEEKKREDEVLTVIGECVTKISQQSFRFSSVATNSIGELAQFENPDLPTSYVFSGAFHKRFNTVKAYVLGISTENERQENGKSPIQQHCDQMANDSKNMVEEDSSDEDRRLRATYGHVCLNYSVRCASNSVRKSRNRVVRQRKVMSKLCALAQRYVSKAEISCKLILSCLKTMVIVLTQAVEAVLIVEAVVVTLEGAGQNLPAFGKAASFAAHWTSEALLDAEQAIRLHKDASDSLQVALWDLDVMRGYQPLGARVLRDITDAGDSYLHVVRQPNSSLAEILRLESNMRTMRRLLTPELKKMRGFNTLIDQWSAICTDTLSLVLQTLSIVTQSSCNAVYVATKAVEDIFVPAAIGLTEIPFQMGTHQ